MRAGANRIWKHRAPGDKPQWAALFKETIFQMTFDCFFCQSIFADAVKGIPVSTPPLIKGHMELRASFPSGPSFAPVRSNNSAFCTPFPFQVRFSHAIVQSSKKVQWQTKDFFNAQACRLTVLATLALHACLEGWRGAGMLFIISFSASAETNWLESLCRSHCINRGAHPLKLTESKTSY